MPRRLLPVTVTFVLLAAACSDSGAPSSPATSTVGLAGDAASFSAQVASSDLATGSPEAVQVGVFSSTADAGVQLLSFGSIDVTFSYLGTDGSQPPQEGPSTAADFVAAPGEGSSGGDGPTLTDPADVAGVYVTPEVTFPQPGIWNATVTASVDGETPVTLDAAFSVYAKHRIPAPGDEALATKNLTLDSKGAPAVAIDSRAQDGAKVPDPALHERTIAEALHAGRPILVQFATPVYCMSNFCGPTVEAQEALASEYHGVAEFIHVEIWRDFDESVVNQAAADWLLRDGDLTEPWMFLIDGDGVIVGRWGPLFDLDDVRTALDALPG
ncbi:MAG: thioredoxin family protein [Actinomycetota bacterium]|nr:thioredoxin family protein [Actinomycetota bacterium]